MKEDTSFITDLFSSKLFTDKAMTHLVADSYLNGIMWVKELLLKGQKEKTGDEDISLRLVKKIMEVCHGNYK